MSISLDPQEAVIIVLLSDSQLSGQILQRNFSTNSLYRNLKNRINKRCSEFQETRGEKEILQNLLWRSTIRKLCKLY